MDIAFRNSAGVMMGIDLYFPRVRRSESPVMMKSHLSAPAASRTRLSSGSRQTEISSLGLTIVNISSILDLIANNCSFLRDVFLRRVSSNSSMSEGEVQALTLPSLINPRIFLGMPPNKIAEKRTLESRSTVTLSYRADIQKRSDRHLVRF